MSTNFHHCWPLSTVTGRPQPHRWLVGTVWLLSAPPVTTASHLSVSLAEITNHHAENHFFPVSFILNRDHKGHHDLNTLIASLVFPDLRWQQSSLLYLCRSISQSISLSLFVWISHPRSQYCDPSLSKLYAHTLAISVYVIWVGSANPNLILDFCFCSQKRNRTQENNVNRVPHLGFYQVKLWEKWPYYPRNMP